MLQAQIPKKRAKAALNATMNIINFPDLDVLRTLHVVHDFSYKSAMPFPTLQTCICWKWGPWSSHSWHGRKPKGWAVRNFNKTGWRCKNSRGTFLPFQAGGSKHHGGTPRLTRSKNFFMPLPFGCGCCKGKVSKMVAATGALTLTGVDVDEGAARLWTFDTTLAKLGRRKSPVHSSAKVTSASATDCGHNCSTWFFVTRKICGGPCRAVCPRVSRSNSWTPLPLHWAISCCGNSGTDTQLLPQPRKRRLKLETPRPSQSLPAWRCPAGQWERCLAWCRDGKSMDDCSARRLGLCLHPQISASGRSTPTPSQNIAWPSSLNWRARRPQMKGVQSRWQRWCLDGGPGRAH